MNKQSLDFVFGALILIGISNLLDQMLDFSRRGSWDLFPVGHLGRSSSRNNINNQIDLHYEFLFAGTVLVVFAGAGECLQRAVTGLEAIVRTAGANSENVSALGKFRG